MQRLSEILNGNGFGLEDCRKAIEIVHSIRNSESMGLKGDYHPIAKHPLSDHPFKSRSSNI